MFRSLRSRNPRPTVVCGVSLLTLASVFALGAANPLLVLGLGSVERWVVYPILLWLTGFGGYLLGVSAPGTHRWVDGGDP